MDQHTLAALAMRGAEARLAELAVEQETIETFLRNGQPMDTSAHAPLPRRRARRATGTSSTRKPMSKAARARVSMRMKRYWKARRAADRRS